MGFQLRSSTTVLLPVLLLALKNTNIVDNKALFFPFGFSQLTGIMLFSGPLKMLAGRSCQRSSLLHLLCPSQAFS